MSWLHAALAVGGGFIVILSFTIDAPRVIDGQTPWGFPWPIFVAGMALAAAGAIGVLRARSLPSAPGV